MKIDEYLKGPGPAPTDMTFEEADAVLAPLTDKTFAITRYWQHQRFDGRDYVNPEFTVFVHARPGDPDMFKAPTLAQAVADAVNYLTPVVEDDTDDVELAGPVAITTCEAKVVEFIANTCGLAESDDLQD